MNNKFNEDFFFKILFNYKGVVFGGYIRDMIANLQPTDIDVVLPSDTFSAFLNVLTAYGYTSYEMQETGFYLFKKEGHLNVEVGSCQDSSTSGIWIGPEAVPDFDVNLLAYDGIKLYNWVNPDAGDIFQIISNIHKRQAVAYEPGEDRVLKMRRKGYTIL